MPSSASVERLFSIAKKVLTPDRMSISDSNFEMQKSCPKVKNSVSLL